MRFPDKARDKTRLVAAARLAVAVGCLTWQIAFGSPPAGPLTAATALFVVYALAALLTWRSARPVLGLLTLLLDTVFFLMFAAYAGDPGAWISSAVYAYLIGSTLAVHAWWDTCIVVAVSALFLYFVPAANSEFLLRLALWTGAVTCPAAWVKHRLEARQNLLLSQLADQEELVRRTSNAERHKLAGDFHDGPLQVFIALQMRLEILGRLMERNPAAAAKDLQELLALHKSQIREIRNFLRGMRPVEVAQGGLASSVNAVVAEFQKNSGIQASFHCPGAAELPSAEAAADVVQIVREALNNVQKHSRASRVAVTLKPANKGIELSIEDNGTGFPFSGTFDLEELTALRIGPFSIEKRVQALKGGMILESHPQLGSTIRVRIPS